MRTEAKQYELQNVGSEALGAQSFIRRSWQSLWSFMRIIRNRFAVDRLRELDEHLLNDIGIDPSDVTKALNVSVLRDPSHQLVAIARDKAKYRYRRL